MEAIKKTKQYKLKESIKECICKEKFNGESQECIICREMQLKKVHEKYLSLLNQIDFTIKEYNIMQRKFEVDLRKLQIKERKRLKKEVV